MAYKQSGAVVKGNGAGDFSGGGLTGDARTYFIVLVLVLVLVLESAGRRRRREETLTSFLS